MRQQLLAVGGARRLGQLFGLLLVASLPLLILQLPVRAQETPTETPEILATPEPATNTVIRIDVDPQAQQPVAAGKEFTARVTVENVGHLAGFSFTIQYDPKKLSFERIIDQGQFIKSTGRQETFCPAPTTRGNTVGVLCNLLGPPVCLGGQPGVSGSGLLGSLVFKSRGDGSATLKLSESALALDDVQPCDPDTGIVQQIPHRLGEDATVQLSGGGGVSWVIIGPSIAVGIVVLAGLGMAALAWRRRRATPAP